MTLISVPAAVNQQSMINGPVSALYSWNPNVNCVPMVVTIEQILGNQTNSQGGASMNGSMFSPGITSPYGAANAKSWLTPSSTTPPGWISPGPSCTVTNVQGQVVSAFVQINGVQRDYRNDNNWNSTFQPINGGSAYRTNAQSDTSFNIFPPGDGTCDSTNNTGCMHSLHVAIDPDWKAAGYCGSNTACDNNTLVGETAAYKSLIDVQGFVFWNPESSTDSSHNFSGWELHPLTAWRISNVPPDYTLSANPNPLPVFSGKSANSTISVDTFNLFSGNISFTATVSPGTNSSGPPPTATMNPSAVTITSGGTGKSVLTVSTMPSTTGNWTVTIFGNNGTLYRAVRLTAYITDFSLAANPASISVPIGSSGQSTLTMVSINGFLGAVSLAAQISPGSLAASLSPSQPTASLSSSMVSLLPKGTASEIIDVSVPLLTAPGTYLVTVTATSGGVSHTSILTVTVTVAGIL